MYQSSVTLGNLIQQDSRTFRARITLGEKTITDGIRSIKINGGSNSEDDFSLGSAVSQYAEITIAAPEALFEGHEFLLEMGVVENDAVAGYIPMGYFTAEKPDSDEEQISFTAYDRMMKMERPCFLELPDSTDTVAVLKAIGTLTGVPVITQGLTAISMQKPVGNTCREVLSYIAQMYGGFAICNRAGQIEIKTYEDHDYVITPGRYWDSFTHNDILFILQKLTCYTGRDEEGEDISISAGAGNRAISFSNPFMTQAALNKVWEKLEKYTYMPGNVMFLGDPRIDPWDILTVEDLNGKSYKVPAMKLTQDFDGGLSTEIQAVGKSEAEQESGFQGPNTKQMDRYYAQLVLLDHAVINKVDADYVEANYVKSKRFEGLEADFESTKTRYLQFETATGNDLTLVHASIERIDGDIANFQSVTTGKLDAVDGSIRNLSGELSTYKTQVAGQLTAFNADITKLKAKDAELENAVIGKASIKDLEAVRTRTQLLETDVAGINTLVNGNLTSDNIHSLVLTGDKVTVENGFIKSAMIDSLAADKITGLDINTTKLTVHSEDGKSIWKDNTIQIADADRIRVQIGKDASGDYNIYIWDKSGNLMFDPLYGVQESGIKRPIIRNDMVSANAAIAGSKLDIESVIREVNGAETTIKGTRIKLDEQNQTLDMAFSTLKTYAEGVNSRTEANETAISVAQGQISTLISNSTVVKDGKTVLLKDAYNSTVADVNSMKTTLNEHTSLIDEQSGEILAVQAKTNKVESDLNGTKQTVSAVQSDLSGTKSRVTTVETGLDGIKSRVSAAETALTKKADGTTVETLTSRVATAESTINGFQASLTATNKTVSDNYTALSGKIEGLSFDGQNLALYTSSEWKAGNVTDITNSCHVIFTLNNMNNRNLQEGDILQIGVDLKFSPDFAATGTGTKASFIQGDCNQGVTWKGITITGGNQQASIEKIIASPSRTGHITTYVKVTKTMIDGTYSGKWIFNIRFNYYKGTVYWRNQMINKGSKPLLWQPAPEDLYAEIDLTNATVATHTETLSTHDTRITAAEKNISLKVSTTDFNSYKTTVTGDINTAKSAAISAAANDATTKANKALSDAKSDATTKSNKALADAKSYTSAQITVVNEHLSQTDQEISIMQGQINLKVSQTDIDSAIAKMEFGGAQILRGTNKVTTLTSTGVWSNGTWRRASTSSDSTGNTRKSIVVTDCPNPNVKVGWEITRNGSTSIDIAQDSVPVTNGQTYTLSCYAKGTGKLRLQYGKSPYPSKTYTLDNVTKWTKYSYTFTVGAQSDGSTGGNTNIYLGNGTNGTIQICGMLLETGNKAGDWSESPYDIDASINAVDAKFASYSTTTQMQSAINLAKTSITQSVSETYATKSQVSAVSGNVTTLTSRVSAAESKLTKDSLVTTIGSYYTTASYVGNAIEGIEIGGRNLITNTAPTSVTGWTASAGWTLSLVDCTTAPYGKAIRATNGTATSGGVHKTPINYAKMVNGEKYTISAWVRASKSCTIRFRNEMMDNNTISVTTAWKKYTFTCAINTGAQYHSDVFYLVDGIANSMWIEVHSLKLEKGTKATDWEPAPEDLESSIDSVKTVATQTADKFNWLVKSGTSSTDFTLTDRTATLVANAINLKGLVTFSGLDSTAQGKITTAQSTADTAKNNAAAAQSTANTANSNATTALNRATYHYGDCGTAAGTAAKTVSLSGFSLYTGATVSIRFNNGNTAASPTLNINGTGAKPIVINGTATPTAAQAALAAWDTCTFVYDGSQWRLTGTDATVRTANNAQSTANTAKTNAANAQTTANTAVTNAANAQSTANTANSTANAVLTNITIQDTRNDNQTPQWYMTNHARKIVKEFKYCSKIGLSVSSTYCTLETKVIWSDASGGYPTQVATVGNDNKVYKRVGTSNTTWSAWESADQTIANWCYNNDKTYINGGKIYTGTIAAAQIAAGAVTAEKINVNSLSAITANLGTVTAGVLQSANYSWTSGNYFTNAGTYISLSTGAIWTKNFTVDQNGNAYYRGTLNGASGSFSGTLTSTAGSIAGWTIESKMLRCGPDFTIGNYLGSAANTTAGVYLSADGGMARFMKYESTYVSSSGKYNNVIRETRIVGGETTGYKATYNNLIVTTEASFYKPSKMYGLSHVTSGGHIVFAADGATLAYLASSSKRYKDYIRDISDSDVENLWSLPVVYAKYKDGYLATDDPCNGKAMPMFFAEDVERLLPDAAVYQNGVVEDWNYRVMIPAMEKQIQVLHRDDAKLLSRTTTLEAKLDSHTSKLEAQLESVQYQLQQAFVKIAAQEKLIKQLQAVG